MPQASWTALVKQSDRDWIVWIEEVPGVNCQEATRELETLRITLMQALDFGCAEARSAAGSGYEEFRISV